MYGILGEDLSDANTLAVIVRKLAADPALSIKRKGYGGCGELLRKGAKQLKAFAEVGCTHLIVCYDADGPNPESRREELMDVIVRPSGVEDICCAVVPVQELEAWIIADITAVSKVFTSWHPKPVKASPETIASPKEYLARLSRAANNKPRYINAIHNERIAQYLDLKVVFDKCPSFRELSEFVVPKPGITDNAAQ